MYRTRELRALLALARAQLHSRPVLVRFRDTERSTAERTLHVLALAFDPPRWIVATWSAQHRSLRLLDLARASCGSARREGARSLHRKPSMPFISRYGDSSIPLPALPGR